MLKKFLNISLRTFSHEGLRVNLHSEKRETLAPRKEIVLYIQLQDNIAFLAPSREVDNYYPIQSLSLMLMK